MISTSILFSAVACGPDEPIDDDHGDEQCPSTPAGDWNTKMGSIPQGALMSVWGSEPDDIYTVGGQPDDGVAYRFDGQSWDEFDVADGPMLNWVHGVDGDVWMVGNDGRALRVRDDDIQSFDTGIDVDLWGVWAASDDDVWAVGGDARDFDASPALAHYDGTSWKEQSLPELDRDANALFKVWGTSSDHIFAVGALGVILQYDGQQWSQVATGANDDFVSLWGRADDDIVAVGGRSNGQVARYDGDQWETELVPGSPGLNGVWMDCQGTAHINGIDGYSFRLESGSMGPDVESTPTDNVLHAIFGFDDGPRVGVGGTLDRSPPYEGTLISTGE